MVSFPKDMALLRIVSATDLRDRLRECIARLGPDPIVVARHGRAVAVMLSPEAWNRFQEELNDLREEIELLEELVVKHGLHRLGPSPEGFRSSLP